MAKKYEIEREGQIDFFDAYGVPHEDGVLIDNTDGVYNGIIFEFKLNITNLSKTLFQAIKYLSKMRVKGESVPATIVLVSLNNTKAYVYKSIDYIDDIQKVYVGAASRDNDSFTKNITPVETIDYSEMAGSARMRRLIHDSKTIAEQYIPIDIDENCIVGWANRYYKEVENAKKGDFLGDDGIAVNVTGEIRNPRHFKGLINPYKGKTNEKFKYLMDCLNDRLSKRDLGAFYTPMPYAIKACELVKMAVDRVPEGNDYVIIDRCAGTGNLEEPLRYIKDKNGDTLLSHCIVSTYEYYEYKVLLERIGVDVREIIPPTETDSYENGRVKCADAMSEEYVNNRIIMDYVNDPNCTIILYENPPYRDETSGMRNNGETDRSGKRKSFVSEEMKKTVKGVATNELTNRFIWSAFQYYLKQPTDSYIVFSPVKYWKQYSFVNATAQKGFIFNREYFHATPSAISCILWINEPSTSTIISLEVFDIENEDVAYIKDINIKKVYKSASKHYPKAVFSEKDTCCVWCAKDGTEAVDKKCRVKSYRDDNVIAYLEADGFSVAPHVRNITVACLYNGNGCYISNDNYIKTLPIWVAKHVPLDAWYEKDVYSTTSDGGGAYVKDKGFLKNCLIYTCFSNQNKCLSFDGSDGRRYQNELCFDYRHDPLALQDINKFKVKFPLDDDERELFNLWDSIMEEIPKCSDYDPELYYGVYQITKELNTFHEESNGKNVPDNEALNGYLIALRDKLKAYYKSHITDRMFEYELLK